MTTTGPRRSEIVAVYAAGLFQGLSLVAVPAAATVLTSAAGYDLSASQYGLLFLPQVILAIAGSLALPSLAGRIGLKRVLLIGLLADTVAMTLLVVSNSVQDDAAAFPMLLVATGSLGLGFGLTLGSISTYAGAFQPERREVALTALNVLLGLGTALSPLLIAIFLDIGEWWYLPLGTRGRTGRGADPDVGPAPRRRIVRCPRNGAAADPDPLLALRRCPRRLRRGRDDVRELGHHPPRRRRGPGRTATYALAAFWAAVTVGRLVIALVSDRVGSTHIYVVLPWVIAVALLIAPAADTGGGRDRPVRPRRPRLLRASSR